MAEMTAAEAIRTAWKFNQPGLVRFIECQESKAKLMSQQIEYCAALIEQQAAEIERLGKSEKTAEIKIAVAHEALVQIKGRSEIPKSEDDAHYENYYEAVSALKAIGDSEIELYDYLGMQAEVAKKERMIDSLKNLRDIQGQKGNYDQGEYMRGMFNGLEVAVSVFTQTEPQFKEWLEKEAEVHGWLNKTKR